jgi:uncharacterized protein (DUF2147 family)
MSFAMKSLMFLFVLVLARVVSAQTSVLGQWKTIDDKSGRPRSIVEINQRNGKIYGQVVTIFSWPGEDPDPVCDQCSADDDRYNQKIRGMEIIREMVKDEDEDEYVNGNILDPKDGNVYRCKIWIEGGTLRVRGYLGPFFRTQTWLRFVR